ncbi:MAG: hypothetical protein ACO3VG_04645 [Nitriliruptoraceae bacterium]
MARDGWLRRARRRRVAPDGVVPLPDSHPKAGLLAEPLRVALLDHVATDPLDDGTHRVTFLVEVRAADDARCPAIAVEAHVAGPERARTVSGATDLFGRIRFRMAGPPGSYACTVTDVAAGGLVWDRAAGPTSATATVPGPSGPGVTGR